MDIEMKLEKDTNNRLLNRREMLLSVSYKGVTPSREEIRAEASRRFNLKKENVVVVSIGQIYGSGGSDVVIHEYADEKARAIAQRHMLERKPSKKDKVAKEAPKAEASAKQE
jgi:ribosomal protein S24E